MLAGSQPCHARRRGTAGAAQQRCAGARRRARLRSSSDSRVVRPAAAQPHQELNAGGAAVTTAVPTARARGGSGGGDDLRWHTVDGPALWRGPAEAVLAPGSPVVDLSPIWRMMILSDGSVTRHLELITGRETTVECMQMQSLDGRQAADRVPAAAQRIPSPLLQRQVLLRASGGPPLVYAASWWCARTVDRFLADSARPIWTSLSLGHVEVHREILEVYHGHSPELESLLGCRGPFWGRNYFFHHKGAPLTLIHEVFSNRLADYLGPQRRQAPQ